VKVLNFVTYEKAEFFLGPNLNMVIGPNGTGKSSLVCAICLGLGYATSVLGRASAFGEFVKHGRDEAEIEVELQKRPDDAENYVVGLCIRREDDKRRFTINGQRANLKDVQQLMRTLSIQIDNLCQFLPQDKVAEFAGLSPVELLEKTLQAAAPPQMIDWQKDLKSHFKSQQEAQRSAEQSNEQLRNMEARQQILQADVEKLRERRQIQESIAKLEKLQVIVEYNTARREYAAVKKRAKEAELNLKRLQQSSAPSLQAVNRKQEYYSKIQAVVEARKRLLRTAETNADQAIGQVEAAEAKCQEVAAKIEAERTGFTTRKQEIGKIRSRINQLETQYKKRETREFDAADWNRRIREQEHLERDAVNEIAEVDEKVTAFRIRGNEIRKQQDQIHKELAALDSQQGQLLNQLKKINPDVARGWEWLKENQGSFEKEVFGPPMLTCSVNNPRYSDLVQSVLQADDFMCFTAQTRADHKKLSNQFYKDMGLSVTIRTCFASYDSFRRPMEKAALNDLCLDGYVVDYLEGPDTVLAMLCAEKKLHASAVALADLSDAQFERIQQGEKINQFAAGKQLYRITRRREYGPGAVSTRVSQVPKGRFWTDQPVDAAEKAELLGKLEVLKNDIIEMKPHYRELQEQLNQLKARRQEALEKSKELKEQKSELQREFNKWQSLPDKIDSEKKLLEKKQQELTEARSGMRELELRNEKAVLEKAKAILQHHKSISRIREAYQALLEVQVLLIEAKSDFESLKAKNSDITQKLESEKKVLEELNVLKTEQHAVALKALENVAAIEESEKQELGQIAREKTLEDVEREIGTERAKLEVIQASNPQALEEFENWTRRIERERANHASQEAKLADLNTKIDRIRSRWEPKLDELVGRINEAFSYNFEQISCAGEVGVHKDEDFDKWAIEIKVKFRENETLQRLDQHRQSGGERAVSTIFYLMSLQSMAQAPFRVVDEINQGMDPRNERMVHERMVEIACREHTSQYFLITPKLLPGLAYDKRMRVHTIVSGEWVDEQGTEKMNFSKFVRVQRAIREKALRTQAVM